MAWVRLWRVEKGQSPTPVLGAPALLELDLEEWLYRDPSLVDGDLMWLGRQLVLQDKSRLDLFGVTMTGEWVVAELKAGAVDVWTLSQALAYALNLAALSAEQLRGRIGTVSEPGASVVEGALEEWDRGNKPMQLLLVGTRASDGLEAGVEFLRSQGLALRIRSAVFQVFEAEGGARLLARSVEDLSEETSVAPSPEKKPAATLERVLEQADVHGLGSVVRSYLQLGREHGFPIRAYARSFAFMSPVNRARMYFYVSPRGPGRLSLGHSAENICRDHPLEEASVREALGGPEWGGVSEEEARTALERWRAFLLAHAIAEPPSA